MVLVTATLAEGLKDSRPLREVGAIGTGHHLDLGNHVLVDIAELRAIVAVFDIDAIQVIAECSVGLGAVGRERACRSTVGADRLIRK